MSELFLTVLNMSFTASYAILVVIIVRLLLKKAPKFISYALWIVVAFRLAVPFSFESVYSLIPRDMADAPVRREIVSQHEPQINNGTVTFEPIAGNSLPAPVIDENAGLPDSYVEAGAYIWISGITALLVYSFVSVLVLKRRLKDAQLTEGNIYEAENLKTPFVFGLLNSKIYLPAGLTREEQSYIILHEKTHIRRKDHIVKILAFVLIAVHWFNPLAWISFMLMSTDMELSCDERVLKAMGGNAKKPYAGTLLSLAAGRYILNGSPLAFSEGNVKSRIKNILNYKKPKFWVIASAVIIAAVVGAGLLTNPAEIKPDSYPLDFSEAGSTGMEAIQSKKSVSLPDKDNKTFEVYFKPNEHDQYVLNPGNDLKKAGEEDDHILQAGEEIKLPDFQYDGNDPVEKLVYATEIEKFSRPERGFTVIASKIFGSYEESGMLKVFVTTYGATYRLYGNVLDIESGGVIPVAITYRKDSNGNYRLEKYEQAGDGADFVPSIREFCTMPVSGKKIRGLAEKITEHYTNREDLHTLHWKNLYKHLKENGINDATLYYPDGEIKFTMSDPKYAN